METYQVRFIDDPLVEIDGNNSGHLSDHKNGQGNIVFTASSSVMLTVGSPFFVSGGGNTKLYKKTNGSWGNPISQGQSLYTITTSGEYSYLIDDGANPATYFDFEVVIQPTQYALTVVSGSGSGNYAANTQVTISANAAPSGQIFDKWTTNNGGTFLDENSSSTTFTMPANAVTVTATYKTATRNHIYLDYSVTDNTVKVWVAGAAEGETFTLQIDGTDAARWEFTIEGNRMYHLRAASTNVILEAWVKK
ncbi:MAG: hypothetical protein LBF89_12730 [Bacteroidales bacterium]|nr:hypothetical protein [Bacteroidales bacterium]